MIEKNEVPLSKNPNFDRKETYFLVLKIKNVLIKIWK